MRTLAVLLMGLLASATVRAATGVENLLAAAQRGDGKAETALRMQLAAGTTPASDELGRVTDALRTAALTGNADAQNRFAYLFEAGIGMPRDYHQAERWYLRAAEQGMPAAQYRLGRMYHEGLLVGKDRRRGYIWLSLAAESGFPDAPHWRDLAARTLAPDDLAKARAEAAVTLAKIRKTPQ